MGHFTRDLVHLGGIFPPKDGEQTRPDYCADLVVPIVEAIGTIKVEDRSALQVNGAAGVATVFSAKVPSNIVWKCEFLSIQHDDPVARVCRMMLRDPSNTDWVIDGDASLAQNLYRVYPRAGFYLGPGWGLSANATALAAGQILRIFLIYIPLPMGAVFPGA